MSFFQCVSGFVFAARTLTREIGLVRGYAGVYLRHIFVEEVLSNVGLALRRA